MKNNKFIKKFNKSESVGQRLFPAKTHYLSEDQGEDCACAFLLGGIERNEDFFLAFLADRESIIAFLTRLIKICVICPSVINVKKFYTYVNCQIIFPNMLAGMIFIAIFAIN